MSRMFDDPKRLMSKANIRDKWEPPIQITLMKDLESAVREHQENAIFAEVRQAIGVDIDKKRLMEALEYSRQSWLDGYAAGQKDAVKLGRWNHVKEHAYMGGDSATEWDNFYCSECSAPSNSPHYYCPYCGATMCEEVNPDAASS